MKFVNKLSTKTLGFDKKTLQAMTNGHPEEIALAEVFGLAKEVKTGEGDNGPWVGFKGNFEGVNLETGKITRSCELFVPPSITPMLESMIPTDDESFMGAQFAIGIGVKEAENAIGYEFTAASLTEVSENDPLLVMRNALEEKRKAAIAPPKKAEKKADKKTEK